MSAQGNSPKLKNETIIATTHPTIADTIDDVELSTLGKTIADNTPYGIYIKKDKKYLFVIFFLKSVRGKTLGRYDESAITPITDST